MLQNASFTLVGLAYRCRQETARFQRGQLYDAQYCLELFRRALTNPALEQSKQAWGFIHQQYLPQVILWVKRHPLFPATGQEPAMLAELALEKMWVSFALSPDKFSRFPGDDDNKCLKALLQFLKTCVHSVVIDMLETAENGEELSESIEAELEIGDKQAFWHCIYQRLNSEKERLVIDATYVYGLKPRQIYAIYPGLFRDVGEIHRTKENVLARFRRDGSLRECLGE